MDWHTTATTLAPATFHILPHQVEAVIFDLDGTLLDTERLYRIAFNTALTELGYTLPTNLYDTLVGLPNATRRTRLPFLLGPDFDTDRFFTAYYRNRNALLAHGVPHKSGALPTLAWLQAAELPVAIATSASIATANRHIALAGLTAHFSCVVTREHVATGKPAPDTFTLAANRLGIAAHACLAVEDSPHGIRAAHAAGMMVAMIPDLLPPSPQDLAYCTTVLPHLLALPALIAAIGNPPAKMIVADFVSDTIAELTACRDFA